MELRYGEDETRNARVIEGPCSVAQAKVGTEKDKRSEGGFAEFGRLRFEALRRIDYCGDDVEATQG